MGFSAAKIRRGNRPEAANAAAPLPERLGEFRLLERLGGGWTVVEGVGTAELKTGAGHMPDTPLPGMPGNAVISGHRTTYGAPFNELDELLLGPTGIAYAEGDPVSAAKALREFAKGHDVFAVKGDFMIVSLIYMVGEFRRSIKTR